MRLSELAPEWLVRDGQRVGFMFFSPVNRKFWQTCFFSCEPAQEQWRLTGEVLGPDMEHVVQHCNEGCAWSCTPDPQSATWENITIMPSLDGSAGGLWHGFITGGRIVGGGVP